MIKKLNPKLIELVKSAGDEGITEFYSVHVNDNNFNTYTHNYKIHIKPPYRLYGNDPNKPIYMKRDIIHENSHKLVFITEPIKNDGTRLRISIRYTSGIYRATIILFIPNRSGAWTVMDNMILRH